MIITQDKKVGETVAKDFRLASVFDKYGIDFCCGGGQTISEVCKRKNIDTEGLLRSINEMTASKANKEIDYDSWPIDLLADYIEKKHHRYVREQMPVIKKFLDKLCKVHGERHPELFKINELFSAVVEELTKHLRKEEMVLFPYIRKMVTTYNGKILETPEFRSVKNPINMMMDEHDTEGERFRKIGELTSNYTPPDDACNTYKAAFVLLKEFESDLHIHIHLENNILFPKTITFEENANSQ